MKLGEDITLYFVNEKMKDKNKGTALKHIKPIIQGKINNRPIYLLSPQFFLNLEAFFLMYLPP